MAAITALPRVSATICANLSAAARIPAFHAACSKAPNNTSSMTSVGMPV